MKIVTIKFVSDGKIVDYKVLTKFYEEIKLYDYMLINTGQLKEIGTVINKNEAKEFKNDSGEGEIEKGIDEKDRQKIRDIKQKAVNTIMDAQDIVDKNQLQMNIVDAELSFDEKKLTFYFSAQKRIDFRKLVSDLVKHFKKVIRLQQIGSREEIQKLGGYGKCGQEVCCKRFLKNLGNVSLDFAKNQNLADSVSNKINGSCGKLMCCLAYENEQYTCEKEKMPKIGEKYKNKDIKGEIIKQNIIEKSIIVKTDDNKLVKIKL